MHLSRLNIPARKIWSRSLRFSLLVLLLAACGSHTPTEESSTTQATSWGEVITIEQAAQINAPVILPSSGRVLLSWFSTDTPAIKHQMGVLNGDSVTLPLPANSPHEQTLLPLEGQNTYLIWKEPALNGAVLKSATLATDFAVERGPIDLAEAPIYHYSAITNLDNTVSIAFSTGLLSEPEIHLKAVDGLGRPRAGSTALTSGDWPVLRWEDEELWLYWMNTRRAMVYAGKIENDSLIDVQEVSTAPKLDSGDYIVDFMVGSDATHLYFTWNLLRGAVTPETWLSTVDRNTLEQGDLAQLMVRGGKDVAVPVQWASPVAGASSGYSAAVQVEGELSILHFEAGEITAFERIAELTVPGLFGKPSYVVDTKGTRYLAWSQPMTAQYADLRLVVSDYPP